MFKKAIRNTFLKLEEDSKFLFFQKSVSHGMQPLEIDLQIHLNPLSLKNWISLTKPLLM